MTHLETTSAATPEHLAAIEGLLARATQADGEPALSDHLWVDLVQAHRGYRGVVALADRNATPVAYAQLSPANDSWSIEVVVDPDHRDRLESLTAELLTASLREAAAAGGGRVHWLVKHATAVHERIAVAAGLAPARVLHQMRRLLPTGLPVEVATRGFVVGRDEEAWLRVNNRAFAGHPEQGGWTIETVEAREAEPWFDPDGFLLHERDGRLAGFCWTKVHTDRDPVLGEIYVIAVDPDFNGLGLGRSLTLAGLDHMARNAVATGMLYVDGANTAAVRMYEGLGFGVHHDDRAFVGAVTPLSPRPAPART